MKDCGGRTKGINRHIDSAVVLWYDRIEVNAAMEGAAVGNRIIILGCPGSGKSTLAAQLHRRTGLPLIHLDSVWWRADGTHISREEFDRRLGELLAGERWIIDGDYSRTYEPRFAACDTVIFLDYSEKICMRSVTERIGKSRPDLPWTEDRPDPELMEDVARYREAKRPKVLGLLDKYADRRTLVFTERARAEEWLAGLERAEKE